MDERNHPRIPININRKLDLSTFIALDPCLWPLHRGQRRAAPRRIGIPFNPCRFLHDFFPPSPPFGRSNRPNRRALFPRRFGYAYTRREGKKLGLASERSKRWVDQWPRVLLHRWDWKTIEDNDQTVRFCSIFEFSEFSLPTMLDISKMSGKSVTFLNEELIDNKWSLMEWRNTFATFNMDKNVKRLVRCIQYLWRNTRCEKRINFN